MKKKIGISISNTNIEANKILEDGPQIRAKKHQSNFP